MEDGAKIHQGYANAVRGTIGLQGFEMGWPPSSPDLNPIEKIWRWMKNRISQMEPFPTTIEDLKAAVQALWDEMDPTMWIKEIEKQPAKLQAVLDAKGYATKY